MQIPKVFLYPLMIKLQPVIYKMYEMKKPILPVPMNYSLLKLRYPIYFTIPIPTMFKKIDVEYKTMNIHEKILSLPI